MPSGVKTCNDIASWYEENFARRMPLLRALSGEQPHNDPADFGLRNDPAVAYVNIALGHSVHHRPTLSVSPGVGAKVSRLC